MSRPTALLGLLLPAVLLGSAVTSARPRNHVLVADFEAEDSLACVETAGAKAERIRGRLKLGRTILRWMCEKGAPLATLTLKGVPADLRPFRNLQFRVRADREMTDDLLVEIRSGEDVLQYEVDLFRRKGRFVSLSIPEPTGATENFNPEAVTEIRLLVRKPRKAWVLDLDDFVLAKEPGGWKLTVRERLVRYFGAKQATRARRIGTKHFEIFSDDSRVYLGKFPKKLEATYAFIRRTLDAPEFEEPLEVIVFDELIDYQVFCAMKFHSLEQAERTSGHATRNYFASSFISTRDPVFAHELTHCVFMRALGSGGGSWLQEGAAVHVQRRFEKKSAAELFAPSLRAGKQLPLDRLFGIPTLAYSKSHPAALLYAQAGAFFEFLWRGPYGAKAIEAVKELAKQPRGLAAAARARRLEEMLGEPVAKIQERWLTWGRNPPPIVGR